MDTRISLEATRDVILKIADYAHAKVLVAYVFIFMSWAFNGEYEILAIVYSLIFLDCLTGVWAVLKLEGLKGFKSRQFFRSPLKFVIYLLLMYVARMVDKSVPFPFAGALMDGFLVTTEAVSILENVAKLDFPIPVALLAKFKSIFPKK